MSNEVERIAKLEALFEGVRDDVRDMKEEEQRTRRRLHDVEGALGTLVDQEKVRIRVTAENQRRMRTRIEVLTAVVACAALFEPFLYHLAIGN